MPDEDFTAWTPEGAARLRAAAADLAGAITAHAEAVSAAGGDADFGAVLAAGDRLLPAVLAYADAQLDYTGNAWPFGVLHQYAEDDEEHEAAEEDLGPAPGVSVLQRHDYQVRDEAAVLSAGRSSYLRVWPEDDEAAAAADVTHLGRALYQIAHAEGWHALDQVEGLDPTGGCVRVVRRDETLGPDPNEWPDNLFDDEGQLLFQQDDVFPG